MEFVPVCTNNYSCSHTYIEQLQYYLCVWITLSIHLYLLRLVLRAHKESIMQLTIPHYSYLGHFTSCLFVNLT